MGCYKTEVGGRLEPQSNALLICPRPEALADRLLRVRDVAMRAHKICETIASLSAVHAASILDAWLALNFRKSVAGRELLVSLHVALERQWLAPDVIEPIYLAAREMGLRDCAELFFTNDIPATASETGNTDRHETRRTNVSSYGQDVRSLTLGERKSLARGMNRENLQQLMRDASIQVAELLLNNPRLTELDVVQMAASAQTPVQTLLLICSHIRWPKHASVRLSLAQNPHLPRAAALRLISSLLPNELRTVAKSAHLDPSVRRAIDRRLKNADDV